MKKTIYICSSLVVSLVMLLSSSCSYLDQEPDDLLTLEMVFNDEERTQQWLADVYSYLPDPYWGYGRSMGFNPLSDEVQIPLQWINFGWWAANVQQGNWSVKTRETSEIWEKSYKAVRAAYVFINNAKALPNKGLSQEQADMMKLEARFLIAFYYAQMLELYGPFPLITREISTDASLGELMLSRTPFDEIVDWLDVELKDLAQELPVYLKNEDSGFGRPTRGIALAVRARMLLVAASPLFNGNSLYSQVVNKDGVHLFSQSYDQSKWKRAADASKELIDLAETGVYKLYTETSNGVIDPFLSFQNLFLSSGDKNKEIIFARPRGNDNWEYDKHAQPRGFGGNGGYGVTQQLVDAFYTKNGLPIDEDPTYLDDGFSTSDVAYPNTSWTPCKKDDNTPKGLITTAGTYNMYVNREPRFYITVRYNNQWLDKENRNTQFYNQGLDGPPSYDSPQCGYLVRKRIHPESIPRNNYTPYRPGIIFRLGEFYLSYAEALNEYEPNNADISKYMNLIRERAGIPALQSNLLGNQKEMRETIRQERQIELATEGKRYTDIRRWMIGNTVFAKPIAGMNPQGDATSFYKRTNIMSRVFENKMYLWPIYQDFMDSNPNLTQNYGW